SRAGVFQVRSDQPLVAPRSYTVAPNSRLIGVWTSGQLSSRTYGLAVYGPNGFFRLYKGGLMAATTVNIQCTLAYDLARNGVTLTALNSGTVACELKIANAYTHETMNPLLNPGANIRQFFALDASFGWYDL